MVTFNIITITKGRIKNIQNLILIFFIWEIPHSTWERIVNVNFLRVFTILNKMFLSKFRHNNNMRADGEQIRMFQSKKASEIESFLYLCPISKSAKFVTVLPPVSNHYCSEIK